MAGDRASPAVLWHLAVYILGTLLLSISMGMNAVLLPVRMLEKLSFPEYWIGVILSVEILAALAVCLTLVPLFRYVGLFACLLASAVARWAAMYFLADADSKIAWLLLVLMHGLGAYLTLIMLQVLVTSLPFGRRRLLVTALFGISISIGFAVGPPLVEFCRESTVLDAAFPALAAVFPAGKPGFSASMLLGGLAGLVVLVSGRWRDGHVTSEPSGHIFGIVKQVPQPLWAIACAGVAIFGVSAFITVYGINNGLSAFQASLLLSAFMLGCIVLDGVFAWFISVLHIKDALVLTIFVGMICSIFLPIAIYDPHAAAGVAAAGDAGSELAPRFWLTASLLFVWGGANASTYSQAMSSIAARFSGDELVAANAAFSFMDTVGGVFGVMAIGFAMHFAQSEGLPYVVALVSVIYFSYVLTQRRIE